MDTEKNPTSLHDKSPRGTGCNITQNNPRLSIEIPLLEIRNIFSSGCSKIQLILKQYILLLLSLLSS